MANNLLQRAVVIGVSFLVIKCDPFLNFAISLNLIARQDVKNIHTCYQFLCVMFPHGHSKSSRKSVFTLTLFSKNVLYQTISVYKFFLTSYSFELQ